MPENENDYGVDEESFKDLIAEEQNDDPEASPEEGNGKGGNGQDDKGEDADTQTAVDTGEEDSKEAKPAGEDSGEEPETPAEEGKETLEIDDMAKIVIDGEPALYKELVQAYKDKKNWSKVNTEKAMALAAERKEFDKERLVVSAYSNAVKLIKDNPEVLDAIKEHFSDDKAKLKMIEDAVSADPVAASNPYEGKINELQSKLDLIEQEKAFNAEKNDTKVKHDLKDSDLVEIEKLILNKYVDSRVVLNFEEGYELWQAKKILANSKQPKKPLPPESKRPTHEVPSRDHKNKSENKSDYDTTLADFEGILK